MHYGETAYVGEYQTHFLHSFLKLYHSILLTYVAESDNNINNISMYYYF